MNKHTTTQGNRRSPRLWALALVAGSALWLSGCGDNANLSVQLSPAVSEADAHKGTIIYSGYSFQIHRVTINGVNYLCNSRGGIIRE